MHPDKTLLGENVVFHKGGECYAAIVVHTHDDDPHKACLVYYCTHSNQWVHAPDATFGHGEGQYSNVE